MPYDPHGPTPLRIGERELSLAKLPFVHGDYRFDEGGEVLTADAGWVRFPSGSVGHRDTEDDEGDAMASYWIDQPPGRSVIRRTISRFPFYD